MKHYLLLSMLFFLFNKAYSQGISGYYVALNNDTIHAQIKVPQLMLGGVNKNKLRKVVKVLDSLGEVTKFSPTDIKSYGFIYKDERYQFVSKPIKNGAYNFLEAIIEGPKTSLYQYTIVGSGPNSVSMTQEFYTFENLGGEYLFLTNYAALKTFKTELKKFYSAHSGVQQLIEMKFEIRRDIQKDIREVVEFVNRN